MPFRKPVPKLKETIKYTQEEIKFLDSIKPWDNKWYKTCGTPEANTKRDAIKDSIKTQLLKIQDYYCAFCGLNLKLAYKIHREHIAPQYKYGDYIFEPENLVLSCNYCNDKKGTKITVQNEKGTYASTTFNILHPYRDDYNKYLSCEFTKNELIFKVIGPEPVKTKVTIETMGLNDVHLVTQRSALIYYYNRTKVKIAFRDLIYSIIGFSRKRV